MPEPRFNEDGEQLYTGPEAMRWALETQPCNHCRLVGTLRAPTMTTTSIIRTCGACRKISIVTPDKFFSDALKRSKTRVS